MYMCYCSYFTFCLFMPYGKDGPDHLSALLGNVIKLNSTVCSILAANAIDL